VGRIGGECIGGGTAHGKNRKRGSVHAQCSSQRARVSAENNAAGAGQRGRLNRTIRLPLCVFLPPGFFFDTQFSGRVPIQYLIVLNSTKTPALFSLVSISIILMQ
jgi:hypothetical protein